MYVSNEDTASVINVKLTQKGREFLAKGLKDDNVFDIVKFSFGDSEVDYTQQESGDNSKILALRVTEAADNPVELKSKLYVSGTIPEGDPYLSLSVSEINLTVQESAIVDKQVSVSVTTSWPPVEGIYIENYSWTNMGPLEDYDFKIETSNDTRVAAFSTYDVTGTTTVKVQGNISGKYELLTVNIT